MGVIKEYEFKAQSTEQPQEVGMVGFVGIVGFPDIQFVTDARILSMSNIYFWGKFFALNIRCFAKKIAFVAFYIL